MTWYERSKYFPELHQTVFISLNHPLQERIGAQSYSLAFYPLFQNMWIGLSDSSIEGTFQWEADNSLINYTHWATEEPNDFGDVEDCVEVVSGAVAGFWNDDFCDSEKLYICERPGGKKLPFHTCMSPKGGFPLQITHLSFTWLKLYTIILWETTMGCHTFPYQIVLNFAYFP